MNFTFVVTNVGNVTLTGVSLSDPVLDAVTCPASILAPGESMTCTGSPYTVTSADAKRGRLTNSATVSSAYCPASGCVLVEAADTVTLVTAKVADNSDGGGLAATGASGVARLVGLGVGILAAGVVLLVAARRRRRV